MEDEQSFLKISTPLPFIKTLRHGEGYGTSPPFSIYSNEGHGYLNMHIYNSKGYGYHATMKHIF
jgi:hypothetical protein